MLTEKHQLVWLSPSFFLYINSIKNAIYVTYVIVLFFTSKNPLMSTLNKTCALTSRKYVSEADMNNPHLLKKLQFSWLHSPVFPLEK